MKYEQDIKDLEYDQTKLKNSQIELWEMKTMAIEIKTLTGNKTHPSGELVNGKIDTRKVFKIRHWETNV